MKSSKQVVKSNDVWSRILLLIAFLIGMPTVVALGAQSPHNGTTTRPSIPSPEFTGFPTSGLAPLEVQFTDQSIGGPTGFAWYFGDEDLSKPWEFLTDSFWSPRSGHTSVALLDGNIVLMGGTVSGGFSNEVWRSTDGGMTWSLINANAPWLGRNGHTSVALPNGNIVLMGGWVGGPVNDIWQSTDFGTNWAQVTPNAAWTHRHGHTSVVLQDESIVLMGGSDGASRKNDVWRSFDGGITWVEMTAAAHWSARVRHTSVALADDSIVLMGGQDDNGVKNDVWLSSDGGANWDLLTDNPAWVGREGHTSVILPDGSIVLVSGKWWSDVWRSIDGGITWNEISPNTEWLGRFYHTNVVLTDGSILLMGGWDGNLKNDVWRLETAGSNQQNPIHIYMQPGSYQVTLQVSNPSGYHVLSKSDYIMVLEPDDFHVFLPLILH